MDSSGDATAVGFRYGVVFLITLFLVVFLVAVPDGRWARVAWIGGEGLALTVVMATSHARAEVRRARVSAVGGLAGILIILIAADVLSRAIVFAIGGLLAAVIPAALVGGLIRLLREHGVTLRAVLGALTIYLFVGLLFAWIIAFISAVSDAPYFAQPGVGQGDRVYFSFSVLTTTGFGDLSAATPVGHALAVVEMLLGQLYLVTVIGVLVGGLASRRRP